AAGGGIDVYRSSPFITHNVIMENTAIGAGVLPGSGGGISVTGEKHKEENTSPAIVNNVVVRNEAREGGGIDVKRARPLLAGNASDGTRRDGGGRPRDPPGPDPNTPAAPALDPTLRTAPPSPLIDAGSTGVLDVEPGPDGDPNTPVDNHFLRLVVPPTGD